MHNISVVDGSTGACVKAWKISKTSIAFADDKIKYILSAEDKIYIYIYIYIFFTPITKK